MSWARDEWKLDLPTAALKKISELEIDAENLRKSKQQQHFQLESVSSTLQKQKQLTAEEKTVSSNLRREMQELTRKCSELESQEDKTQIDLKAKDNKIGLLEEQLRRARAKLKEEEDKNSDLMKNLDELQVNFEAKENEIGELRKELEKTAQIAKELDAAKEKVEILCKESCSLRDQLKQRDELLTKHTNQVVETEAVPMSDAADPTAAAVVGGAFVEILKRENNALISDNEEMKAQLDQLKSVLREKEKELERVMEKLALSHAENERTSNDLKTKEREIAKLEKKLRNTEEELRKAQGRVRMLETKIQQLGDETRDSEKRDTEETKEKLECLNNALEDSKNKIRTLESDLTQQTNEIKVKRDRLKTLEEENVQLTQEVDSLKRQNKAAMESYLAMTTVLREKDQRIKELQDDNKVQKRQLRTQGEKGEVLGSENSRLKEELELAEQRFTDTEQSYRSVSIALEESRKAIKNNLDNINQALGDKEISEGLERRKREDYDDHKSRDTKSKCGNCKDLKARLREQEESYTLKIRDLEAYIRDLTTKKDALEQNVATQRRSSEEFTNRVQQMVQKLETEQQANKQDKEENRAGKLRETENFFNMVKRFFTEHEALKDCAQNCLQDLHQLQRYFQGCSDGAKEVISHAQTFETVAKRMSLLKSLLESVVEEFVRPLNDEESEVEGSEDSPLEGSIRAEMTWDNYEREVVFSAFKDDVEEILHQLDKDKELSERKAEELHEIKRAHMALKKVRKRSRQAVERVLTQGDIEELDEVGLKENDLNGPQKAKARMDREDLVDVVTKLLNRNQEELERKMTQHFKRLENTINHQRAQQSQRATDDGGQQNGTENFKEAIDGKFAIGELDLVKRKLSNVQKSIKHLIGSLAETERGRKCVESKMDLLNGELSRKESQYEAKCEDLKIAAKTASEHEVSLRSRIDGLTSDKEEINLEQRRVVGVLKKKELELVEKSQELKHLQTAYKDEQRVMKNKMTALEQENDGLWLDFKEADKRADMKEKEFKELVGRLKTSQGYLHSMFNSLSNMDDELQKARDIDVFSEQN